MTVVKVNSLKDILAIIKLYEDQVGYPLIVSCTKNLNTFLLSDNNRGVLAKLELSKFYVRKPI